MKNSIKPKLRFRRHTSQRPLHKRFVLHPLSLFVVLCFGVIIVGSTWKAHADTIEVSAKVSAPLPSGPAIITSPQDGQHVTEALIDVVGTCPDNTYVKLYRNSAFSGVAQCSAGHFTIQTSLSAGANQLLARVYNVTDDEGPQSSPVTVYYDQATSGPSIPGSQGLPFSNPGINPTAPNGSGVSPLVISGDYKYDIHYAGEQFVWKLQVSGGTKPYTITINWGDGETTTFESADGVLNLSHAFAQGGNYQPIVQATDLAGALVTLQLSAVVKDRPQIIAATSPLMDDIARYLWLLWPVYLVILLMLVSFWLGEIEIAHYIWTHKFSRKRTKKHRHA